MSFIELQYPNFNNESISAFWSELEVNGFHTVRVNLNTEVGSITAIGIDWATNSNLPAIGVRLNASYVTASWEKLALSAITDLEYEKVVGHEAQGYLKAFKDACPPKIKVKEYSID